MSALYCLSCAVLAEYCREVIHFSNALAVSQDRTDAFVVPYITDEAAQ